MWCVLEIAEWGIQPSTMTFSFFVMELLEEMLWKSWELELITLQEESFG